jgi:hypothetical protein
VAIGLLCAIAIVGIALVATGPEDSSAVGRVIFAAVILTVFSLIAMTGIVLSVRRPGLSWLGYLTVLVALAGFGLDTWKLWDAGYFFGDGWELPVAVTIAALACGQVSLLLAWAGNNGWVTLVGLGAALMIVAIAALTVLSITFDGFRPDDRVYGVLAILYLLGIGLLPLLTLGNAPNR